MRIVTKKDKSDEYKLSLLKINQYSAINKILNLSV